MSDPSQIPLVRVQGISKHFGEGETRVDALKDVTLDVHPGRSWPCSGRPAPARPRC